MMDLEIVEGMASAKSRVIRNHIWYCRFTVFTSVSTQFFRLKQCPNIRKRTTIRKELLTMKNRLKIKLRTLS